MGCVLALFRLHFSVFVSFWISFYSWCLFATSMFCRFFPLLFSNHLYRSTVKWCDGGKKSVKKYMNKCDTLNSLNERVLFCHLLKRVLAHWWTCLCFSINGVRLLCCHVRKERRHCTVIFLVSVRLIVIQCEKLSLHFKWRSLTHSLIRK